MARLLAAGCFSQTVGGNRTRLCLLVFLMLTLFCEIILYYLGSNMFLVPKISCTLF